jgi:hypothetical protein
MATRTFTGFTRRAALLALVVAGFVFGSPGFAAAAPGSDAIVASTDQPFTLPAGDTGGSLFPCSPGRALGGGISDLSGTRFSVTRSLPATTDPGVPADWYAEGENIGTGNPQIRAFGICSASSDATLIQGSDLEIGAGQAGGTAVACPAGSRSIGGGATLFQSGSSVLEASGPLDSSGTTQNTDDGDVAAYWYSHLLNTGADSNTGFFWAICSAGSDATVEASPLSLTAGSTGEAVAACPSGRRAVSGGVDVSGASVDDSLSTTAPVDETLDLSQTHTGDVARGWRATVKSNLSGSHDYKVFAMCVSDPPATVPAPPAAGPTGARAAALAKCKKKHTKTARKKCRRKASVLPV